MTKKNAKEAKRELIMDAAVQIFSHKGYHNTKMEEIAAAAGIGKGTIYEYFSSKLQLIQEIMEHSLEVYYEQFSQEEIESLPFKQRIVFLLEVHFRFCRVNADLTRIIFWDADILDEELKEWSMQMRKKKEAKMQELIDRAIDRGEIRPVNSKILALMIMGIMGSIWMPLVIEGWDIDLSDAAKQVTDMLVYGIGK